MEKFKSILDCLCFMNMIIIPDVGRRAKFKRPCRRMTMDLTVVRYARYVDLEEASHPLALAAIFFLVTASTTLYSLCNRHSVSSIKIQSKVQRSVSSLLESTRAEFKHFGRFSVIEIIMIAQFNALRDI